MHFKDLTITSDGGNYKLTIPYVNPELLGNFQGNHRSPKIASNSAVYSFRYINLEDVTEAARQFRTIKENLARIGEESTRLFNSLNSDFKRQIIAEGKYNETRSVDVNVNNTENKQFMQYLQDILSDTDTAPVQSKLAVRGNWNLGSDAAKIYNMTIRDPIEERLEINFPIRFENKRIDCLLLKKMHSYDGWKTSMYIVHIEKRGRCVVRVKFD